MCGGPIVPADVAGLTRSNAELASLVRAKRARAIAFGWTAATVVFGLTALMAMSLGALLLLIAKLPAVILGVLGVALFVGAMGMRGRAKKSDDAAQDALDAGWESVADEVLRVRGHDVTAKDLAAAMRTTEAHAENLLTALSVHDRARIDVGDDAELRYSAEPGAQVRVADDAAQAEREDAATEPSPGAERRTR